jgi:hypothetical protein
VGTLRSTVAPAGTRPAQVVDLHLGAAGRGAGAADDQVALRQRVDLAVGAAQRRGDQGAAAQALGIASEDTLTSIVWPGCAKAGNWR